MKIEQTHTAWKVYEDPFKGLVRVKYPLHPREEVVREYGFYYKNKRTKGPRMLVKWLTKAEWLEKQNR